MTVDCVVVGAGSAGVTTSRALRDAGVEHLVLERGEVGYTWATQRWDSFALNTPGSMNAPLGDVDPAGYSTLAETVALLGSQAEGLPVRAHTPVTSVGHDGDLFRVTTPDDEIAARTVVVASGPKNSPLLPERARRVPAHVTSLHAAEYRSAATLPDGAVLVVGGGQSGAQITHDLVTAGREVWYSTSRVGRYRAHYRGRALLDWHVDCGYWSERLEDLADPASARVATPLIGPNGRDLGLPLLARLGVRLVGRLTEVDGSLLTFVGDVDDYIRYADEVAVELEELADDYIAARGLHAEPAAPDPGRGPAGVDGRPSLDLDTEGVTSVIWCTGFGGDYSYLGGLPGPVLDPQGRPTLEDGGAAGMPALWFVGMPWQSTRSSSILHGIPLDARIATDAVTAELSARAPQRRR